MADTNKKEVKVTLQDLINKKLQKNDNKRFNKSIYVEKIDGELVFEIPTFDELLEYSDEMETRDGKAVKQLYRKLCYDTCKMLHDKELHKAYGVIDPYDIVDFLFYDMDIMRVGESISEARKPKKVTEAIKK